MIRSVLFAFALSALLCMPVTAQSTETDPLPHYPDAPLETVVVEDDTLAYIDTGGDGPPLVLVHGLGSNLSLWRDHIEPLSAEHRVLALDLPGFGVSSKHDVSGRMTDFAASVRGFVDTLELAPVTYVGVSMGGQIGLTLAMEAPETVERLVLVSPAGIETFTDEQAAGLRQMMTPQAIASADSSAIQQNTAANFASWSDDYAWLIKQRHALAERDDFEAYARANSASVAGMVDEPVYDHLGTVQMPTLVLYGTGDKLIPNPYLNPQWDTQAIAQRAAEALPNATVHLVEDAGHLLMIEQPDAFQKHLQEFLARSE
ncbi:MAG: alpha/beta hydrolase [Longimonas sp.]|uniref:alpha/beta fold hydrolase n=1 Tax=Longimonas sp. TaxID=2039626 RepID=UPI00334AD1AB